VTRSLRLVSEAAADLAGAVEWYETHRAGLGAELVREVTRALERRGVVYVARPDEIVVVAVVHSSRRPNFWRGGI
jgi:hypothetical protein